MAYEIHRNVMMKAVKYEKNSFPFEYVLNESHK